MDSSERSIRQSHSPSSIGGSTRSRNSALRWKDHASSPIPPVANTPCRQRACAAPCRSPAQTSFSEQTSHRSFLLAVRLRVLSLTLGSCIIPASSAVLHASLSSALLSLKQVVISSALGMNALQSLSTSGVHAKRCSGVPCENEGAGRGRRGRQGQRHVPLRQGRQPKRHPVVLAFHVHQRTRHPQSKSMFDIVIMADRNTLLPEPALVAKRQPLGLSTPLQSSRLPKAGVRRIEQIRGSVDFAIHIGCT